MASHLRSSCETVNDSSAIIGLLTCLKKTFKARNSVASVSNDRSEVTHRKLRRLCDAEIKTMSVLSGVFIQGLGELAVSR
jgi:hypothetical protein